MSHIGWWLALALVFAAVSWLLLLAVLMRGPGTPVAIRLDGATVDVTVKEDSPLPRFFHAAATTIGYTVCFRGKRRSTLDPIQPLTAAHECYHVWDRHRRGFVGFWARVYWQTLLHPLSHDARPFEQEAIAAAPLILAGTFPGVDASALLSLF